MFIKINILSKNYNSLKSFIAFFINVCETNNLNSTQFLKFFKHPQKNFKYTVLKSPHVNKTAQEQFKYSLFSNQVWICSFQLLKFLILLKKTHVLLLSDIKIKIIFFYNKKRLYNVKTETVNPDNFKIQLFHTSKKPTKFKSHCNKFYKTTSKLQLYLSLFDIYGEIGLNAAALFR
jgi:ribosomal protein S10